MLLVCLSTALWEPSTAGITPILHKQTHFTASRSHTNHLGVCSKRGQALLCNVVQQGQGMQVARPRLHIADGRYPGVTQRYAPAGTGQGRICIASIQQPGSTLPLLACCIHTGCRHELQGAAMSLWARNSMHPARTACMPLHTSAHSAVSNADQSVEPYPT